MYNILIPLSWTTPTSSFSSITNASRSKFTNIKDFDNNVKEVFRECYSDWAGVSDDTINQFKTYIAKLTDNNMQITGCVSGNTISLYNRDYSRHYYVKFDSELEIELWYVEGVEQNIK